MFDLGILTHTLGLTQFGELPAGHDEPYRNYYVGGADKCRPMVEAGLMKEHEPTFISGSSPWFSVTPAGRDYIALNVPKRPPEPTRSKSEQSYHDYQEVSDCYDGFAQYLGINKPKVEYRTYDNLGRPTSQCRYVRYIRTGYYDRYEDIAGDWCATKKDAKASYKLKLNASRKHHG